MMAFFHSINLCHTFLIYSITSLVLFTKITNYGMTEKNERFFVYVAVSAYYVILKEVENRVFRRNRIFRHTCMYSQLIFQRRNHSCFNVVDQH